ncbi:unnamed protein product [Linum tenue]|uniref:Uncharacterized protein n=1 Tax=Linum tenue TaxID=586396 RepID=A0AAV0P0K5_9ROSI|nr:unnamed protein product [Linum tenue]CAI0464059.1 unnamed protein product [Linum tenue]
MRFSKVTNPIWELLMEMFIPGDGSNSYKPGALQTPFTKCNIRGSIVLHWGLSKFVFGGVVVSVNSLELVGGEGKGSMKWLLDEVAQHEKEAERSLMHRRS